MLDITTCKGCGRETYAQLAHCPECAHDITVPQTEMNLPPEYVEVDKTGVRVYPVRRKRIIYISFLVFVVLMLLTFWAFFIFSFLRGNIGNIFIEIIALVMLPVASILAMNMVFYLTGALRRKLPIMVLDSQGLIFPHLRAVRIPWPNLSNIEIQTVTQAFITQEFLKISLVPPLRVFPILLEKITAVGKARKRVTIPVLFGWPFNAETLRDLLLLGHETWAGNRQISFLAPDYEEKQFALSVRSAIYSVIAFHVVVGFLLFFIASGDSAYLRGLTFIPFVNVSH